MNWIYIFLIVSQVINIMVVELIFKYLSKIQQVDPQISIKYHAFSRRDAKGWRRWKFYLFGSLYLFRFLVVIFLIVTCFLITKILTLGMTLDSNSRPNCRLKAVNFVGRYMNRAMLLFCGFIWIRNKQIRVNFEDYKLIQKATTRPSVIVSNHSSCMDIFYYIYSKFPSFFAKQAIANYPFIGGIAKCMYCLFVDRKSANDRQLLLKKVQQRQTMIEQNDFLPQLLLFVEGTTTNGTVLLSFKRGAFFAKKPVLPSAIKYWGPIFMPTMDVIPQVIHILIMLCQPFSLMTVLNFPAVQLKNQFRDTVGWQEYAEQVNRVMREGMEVKGCSDLVYRDKQQFLEIIFNKKKKE